MCMCAGATSPDGLTVVFLTIDGMVWSATVENIQRGVFKMVWAVQIEDAELRYSPVFSADSKTLHVQTARSIYALDASSGAVQWMWSSSDSQSLAGDPVVSADGKVLYCSSYSGIVFAISTSSSNPNGPAPNELIVALAIGVPAVVIVVVVVLVVVLRRRKSQHNSLATTLIEPGSQEQ